MPVVKESVCIIGLGYVGLPLAECFVNAGFRVVGYDADAARIAELRGGRDSGGEVSGARLAALLPKLTLSADIADAEECTAYLIAVPTPLDNVNKPDLSHLRAACQTISGVLKRAAITEDGAGFGFAFCLRLFARAIGRYIVKGIVR